MKHIQQSALLFLFFLAIISLSVNRCTNPDPKILPLEKETPHKPDHKIDFSHDAHAQVDCKYCHNSANDGKTDGIPTANLCMKCHKQITGDSL
ncbi:cytochrome c3 family protein [Fluviicola sp.]|jgi:hypothetical protein|uniref:cytochrome c3 family protein n=1 Tax=Fluviicola sp. TaxID=1917219 RepID=UPI002611279F|nr:cytochrome c3 family protein [Fluviicola sp.]